MRLQKLAYALFLVLMWGPQAAHGEVRITDDRGGRIGDYVDKYNDIRASGEQVVIDGLCASACTLVVGFIDRAHLCATPHAKLAFHQAWDIGSALVKGKNVPNMMPNKEASELLYRYYPRRVRDWIFLHGGLPQPWRLLPLSGRELTKFVPRCHPASTLAAIH